MGYLSLHIKTAVFCTFDNPHPPLIYEFDVLICINLFLASTPIPSGSCFLGRQ